MNFVLNYIMVKRVEGSSVGICLIIEFKVFPFGYFIFQESFIGMLIQIYIQCMPIICKNRYFIVVIMGMKQNTQISYFTLATHI